MPAIVVVESIIVKQAASELFVRWGLGCDQLAANIEEVSYVGHASRWGMLTMMADAAESKHDSGQRLNHCMIACAVCVEQRVFLAVLQNTMDMT